MWVFTVMSVCVRRDHKCNASMYYCFCNNDADHLAAFTLSTLFLPVCYMGLFGSALIGYSVLAGAVLNRSAWLVYVGLCVPQGYFGSQEYIGIVLRSHFPPVASFKVIFDSKYISFQLANMYQNRPEFSFFIWVRCCKTDGFEIRARKL